MALKVIGAGGPRTGTASLKDALEILGFGKCYHMQYLFNNPDEIKYWNELFETGTTDFERMFTGFGSTVDFPGHINYKILLEQYPEAKVILTERDPEKWYESATNTVYAATQPSIGRKLKIMRKMIFSSRFRKLSTAFGLVKKYLWGRLYEGQFKDKQKTLGIYTSFNEEVKKHVPQKQLLCYNISDGWGPLCDFLNVAVPDVEFPFKNQRKEFREQINHMLDTGEALVLK